MLPTIGQRLLLAAALVLAACAIPTDLPVFEPRFIVKTEDTQLGVGQLLPSTITVQGNTFSLALAPVTLSQTLGQLCGPPCNAANGQTVPKPAFTAPLSATIAMPSDVRSVNLTSGTVIVRLNNQLNFDPIRPSANARGAIVLTAVSGSTTIGRDSVPGATVALPAGTTLDRTIPLQAGVLAGPITITATLISPAGDPVTINTGLNFGLTATPQSLVVSSANVIVTNRSVNLQQITLDFSKIDDTIINHTTQGAIQLQITNPFNVSGTLSATFTGPGVNIAPKTIQLTPGTSSQTMPLTLAEVRSLLGNQVTMRVSGTVTGGANGVTLAPAQVALISTRLDLTLTTGSTQ